MALRKSGGYRRLASFQTSTIIYDATVWFCERFLDQRSRTVDQMVQAARSGRQNIAEGSRASATSSQTELRLVNVARASLEELLLDYEDFLRHRHLVLWEAKSNESQAVRSVATAKTDIVDLTDNQRWERYSSWLDSADPAIRANAVICLIHQTNFLLDRQIAALEQRFIEEGGYSEQLATARMEHRAVKKHQEANEAIPECPNCKGLMSLRTAKTGKAVGKQFWGCKNYPDCKGIVPIE